VKRCEAWPDDNQDTDEPRDYREKTPPADPFPQKWTSQQSYDEWGQKKDGRRLVEPQVTQRRSR